MLDDPSLIPDRPISIISSIGSFSGLSGPGPAVRNASRASRTSRFMLSLSSMAPYFRAFSISSGSRILVAIVSDMENLPSSHKNIIGSIYLNVSQERKSWGQYFRLTDKMFMNTLLGS